MPEAPNHLTTPAQFHTQCRSYPLMQLAHCYIPYLILIQTVQDTNQVNAFTSQDVHLNITWPYGSVGTKH